MREPLISETSDRRILHTRIMEALETMPAKLQEVFILTHYEGLSEKEMAGMIGVEVPELSSLVKKANAAFQQAISRSRLC